MGLDMYLEGRKYFWKNYKAPENDPIEDGFPLKERVLELGYWRKHPDLHGYIVKTFADGKDECQEIYLSEGDIKHIIQAIRDNELPHTEGFFFGTSYQEDIPGWSKKEVDDASIHILEGALKWLQTKQTDVSRSIVYQASW